MAVAAPMPVVPPVIRATLPFNLLMMFLFWDLVVALIASLKVTIMPKIYFRCRSEITCSRLIRLKRCSSAFWVSSKTRLRADLILQLTVHRLSTGY